MTKEKVFVTDCEGPITKNDNAFELASWLIPRGDRFFVLISRYDDVLSEVIKRPGYKAGDTLKLILPFLKAYGATDEKIKVYSSENIMLVPGADETLHYIREMMPSYIVSTSYEQYISALCEVINFPKENTYCTKLNIDKYKLNDRQIERLKELSAEITSMPMIEVPKGAESLKDLPQESQAIVLRLNEIFWEELFHMDLDLLMKEINPIGGYEKANAVKNISNRVGAELSDIMYVGDSITDVEPFRLVKNNGGLTVSFNGNHYAVREADVAILSHHTVVIAILAEQFKWFGKEHVIRLAENWDISELEKFCSPTLMEQLKRLYPEKAPWVEKITPDNIERLMQESSAFRKTVRGEAIGKLG